MMRLALICVVLATAAPAAAVPPPDRTDLPVTSLLRRATPAHEVLGSRSAAEIVRAAARLAGVDPRLPAPSAIHPSPEPVGTPGAAADLLATIQAAGRQLHIAVADPSGPEEIRREGARLLSRSLADPAGKEVVGETSALLSRMDDAVDQSRLFGAALAVARAIDDALPRLRDLRTASSGGGRGCDVLDLPMVCIGGEGANTHTEDVALLIDLGGDDVYEGSAGGADPQQNGLPVSVLLDLGGDDTYAASFPQPSGARVAQGGGGLGGVGILVDAFGDDSYRATGDAASVSAQGVGSGGVGLLLDTAGSDRYEAAASRPISVSVHAQGRNSLGGAGILSDVGGGNDTYRAAATAPALGDASFVEYGTADANAHGASNVGGAALLLDDGGRDEMRTTAISEPGTDEGFPEVGRRGIAIVDAAGHGTVGGVGVAATGPGDTIWSSLAEAAPQALPEIEGSSGILAQGAGYVAGYGALLDGGGDDVYEARARSSVTRRGTIDCECSDPPASAFSSDLFTDAQAYAGLGGAALLADSRGNDQYVLEAASSATIQVHDARLDHSEPLGAAAEALLARVNGQGLSGLGSTAVLMDGAGSDSYEANATAKAEAVATEQEGDETIPAPASATAGDAVSNVQAASTGAGHASLIDTGGTDAYEATAASEAEGGPATLASSGLPAISAQGSVAGSTPGSAVFTDLADGGAADDFTTAPEDPTCSGERGKDVWQDCGPGLGLGVND